MILAGCDIPPSPNAGVPGIVVHTQFAAANLCSVGVSPRILLEGVPAKAARYAIQITNINVLFDKPWRETVPTTSTTEIPEGAAKTYSGPCIGDMTRFPPIEPYGYRYRIEVLAMDAGGKAIGYGQTVAFVQSAYVTARRERQAGSAEANDPFAPNPARLPSPVQPYSTTMQPQGVPSTQSSPTMPY